MSTLTSLFTLALALATLLGSIGIGSPRRMAVRLTALVSTLAFLPIAYASFVELLSRPKPVTLEWARKSVAEATVLSSTLTEGVGIYLWLQIDEVSEPRAYVLPWNRSLAEELQEAAKAADGGGLRMRLPFESTLDDRRPRFYPLPQPALPPKDMRRQAPADVDSIAQDA